MKTLLKSNKVLYKIWFYLNKKKLSKNLRLPLKSDDYYFDGYPRSGNTFIKGFINFIFPNVKGASHLHTVAALKIALKLKLPAIVVVRNPFDAIASNLYRKSTNEGSLTNSLIGEVVNDYINYYNYVDKNRKNILIVHFSDFFKDSTFQTLEIIKFLKVEELDGNSIQSKFEDFELKMKSRESKKRNEVSSLPNQKRMEFKDKLKNKILSNPQYFVAQKVYKKLI